MAHVFAAPCVGVESGDCLEVCPMDCIAPGGEAGQHAIDPAGCIDRGVGAAGAVEAIFPAGEVPDEWMGFARLNAVVAAAVTGDHGPATVGSLRPRARWKEARVGSLRTRDLARQTVNVGGASRRTNPRSQRSSRARRRGRRGLSGRS